MVVGIVDGEEKFSRLWQESSYLSVIPSRENALAIPREEEAIALKARDLDSQELLPCLGVPHSDIVHLQVAKSSEYPAGKTTSLIRS